MNILEARRRVLGGEVYKKTAEGNPVSVRSLARMRPGLSVMGKSTQKTTTGAQLLDVDNLSPDPSANDIASLIISDGGYEWEETSAFTTNRYLIAVKPNTNYTLSVGSITRGANLQISDYLQETKTGLDHFVSVNETAFSFNTGELSEVTMSLFSGLTGIQKITDIMLCEGTNIKPWEPYTGGKPSPSPDYPQEIVSAGKYDEGTGKYQYTIKISDSEESPTKSQTVTLTSDRPLTKWDKLEKRNGQWGWVYKSNTVTLDGSEDEAWYLAQTDAYNQFYINIDTVEHLSNEKNAYCKKFRPAVITDRETEKEIIYTVRAIGGAIGGAIAVSTELATEVDAWKTWLRSNPITVLYKSTEETFVPLSSSEQEQMNELYTFRPTTVLSNDCECEMTLTYKTKKSLEVTT